MGDEQRSKEELIAELETLRNRVAQLDGSLGVLAGGIAHDLNNLLTVIMANTELMGTSLPAYERKLHSELDEVANAARRGAGMVKRLLGYSRRAALTLRPVDLSCHVRELKERTFPRYLPDSISVRFTHEESLPPIHADPGAVEQIVINLVTNARDAMPHGGELSIDVSRTTFGQDRRVTRGWGDPGEYIRLTVADNGQGMDSDAQGKIFEPFFTTKPGSAGLGMPMIYGLAKQHRGYVEVDSEVGNGTTVQVFFPIATAEMALEPGMEREQEIRGGRETILVVDDEAPIRRAARRILERFGYTVLQAADGAEAQTILHSKEADISLVVSDVIMPKVSGPELYEWIKKQRIETEFIFMSGYTPSDLEATVPIHPRLPFLQKPWMASDLLMKVRTLLDAE